MAVSSEGNIRPPFNTPRHCSAALYGTANLCHAMGGFPVAVRSAVQSGCWKESIPHKAFAEMPPHGQSGVGRFLLNSPPPCHSGMHIATPVPPLCEDVG